MEQQFSLISVYYDIDALLNLKKFTTVEFRQLSTQVCGSMVEKSGMDWWIGTSSRETNGWETINPKREVQIMSSTILSIGGGGQPSIGGGGQPGIGGGGQPNPTIGGGGQTFPEIGGGGQPDVQ